MILPLSGRPLVTPTSGTSHHQLIASNSCATLPALLVLICDIYQRGSRFDNKGNLFFRHKHGHRYLQVGAYKESARAICYLLIRQNRKIASLPKRQGNLPSTSYSTSLAERKTNRQSSTQKSRQATTSFPSFSREENRTETQ